MTYAGHIRARVFARGHALGKRLWHFEVVNGATGVVVASDNTCSHDVMVRQAHNAVAIARGTWLYGLDAAALSERGQA